MGLQYKAAVLHAPKPPTRHRDDRGKVDVESDVAFRWGSLMQEKRIRRSSYGGARPLRDFPLLAQAALDGRLRLDELITARITLEQVNEGFDALKRGAAIRSVVMF